MPKSSFSSYTKVRLVLTGLLLFGLLAACGDNTATNQPNTGGQVPPNTAAPMPTNTHTPLSIATVAQGPTATPAPNITTVPAMTPYDPNMPIPTPKPFPTGKPVAGITNFGTTENLHGQFINAEAMQKFLDAYAQGQSGQSEYVLYTTEGAPLPTRFVYKGIGREVTLIADSTRDGYTAPEDRKIETYTCQQLTEISTHLEVTGCVDSKANKVAYGFDFPLH